MNLSEKDISRFVLFNRDVYDAIKRAAKQAVRVRAGWMARPVNGLTFTVILDCRPGIRQVRVAQEMAESLGFVCAPDGNDGFTASDAASGIAVEVRAERERAAAMKGQA